MVYPNNAGKNALKLQHFHPYLHPVGSAKNTEWQRYIGELGTASAVWTSAEGPVEIRIHDEYTASGVPIGVSGIQGPPGPAGGVGAPGPQGLQGIPGSQGIPGPQGDPGPQGPQGTVGSAGPQGAQGAPGAPGLDGADGDNAYERAVANGFVGTEVQWLVSLIGPAGVPGANGMNGINGNHGVDGAPGQDGQDGQDGAPGQDGVDGAPGPQGPAGADGDQITALNYHDTTRLLEIVGSISGPHTDVLPVGTFGTYGVLQLLTQAYAATDPTNDTKAITAAFAQALIADAIVGVPGDKYLQGLASYTPATNTLVLNMSDGSTVPVDLTGLLNDAIATITAGKVAVHDNAGTLLGYLLAP